MLTRSVAAPDLYPMRVYEGLHEGRPAVEQGVSMT